MKNFIVYSESGQILRSGVCADNDLSLQGKFVIEGKAKDGTQYIDNGNVIDMPPKPSEFHFFNYKNKEWVFDENYADQSAKQKRNLLLGESDWTQLPDVPIQTQIKWKQYRQELRDLTSQTKYPFNIVWPVKPD